VTKLLAILKRRWVVLVVTTVVGVVAGVSSTFLASDRSAPVYTVSEVVVARQGTQGQALVPQDELRITRGEVTRRAAEQLGDGMTAADVAASISTEFDEVSSSITVSSNDTVPERASARVEAVVDSFLAVASEESQADGRRLLEEQQARVDDAEQQLVDFDAANPQISIPGAAPNDVVTAALIEQRRQIVQAIAEQRTELQRLQNDLDRSEPYDRLGPEAPRLAQSGLVSVPNSAPIRGALLGLLGFLLGAVVVLLIERLNRRIDTREELTEVVDLPVLAEVGLVGSAELERPIRLDGPWAEPYRRVRAAMQFVHAADAEERPAPPPAQTVGSTPPPPYRAPRTTPSGEVYLVTSTSPGEGKSTSTALIAQALAEVGTQTLVVGGDFRRPEVDRLLGVGASPSLLDLARAGQDAAVDQVVHSTANPNIWVAPSGPPTREVVSLVDAAKRLCVETRRRGGTVVLDSSPLRAASDTLELLPVVDHVIMVVRSGRTTEAGLRQAVEALRRLDADILGVVLVGAPGVGREQAYYDDYYAPRATPDGAWNRKK
jgi:Mrp family chromosome partitioning ATPase/capsular polysaccharide biosynthesis protein